MYFLTYCKPVVQFCVLTRLHRNYILFAEWIFCVENLMILSLQPTQVNRHAEYCHNYPHPLGTKKVNFLQKHFVIALKQDQHGKR